MASLPIRRGFVPPRLSRPLRWLAPFAATGLVFGIQNAVLPHPSLAPFVLFFFGVVLAAWLAGVWVGLATVVLSAVVANYFFLEPYNTWAMSSEDVRATIMFVASASSVAWFAGTLRNAMEQAEDAVEQVREASRRKDQFLAVLSHELRNPLAPIRNSVHILRRALAGSDQEARAKDVIERQVEHMTRLVDDLLDASRIARGQVELHKEDVDIAALVTKAVDDQRSIFERVGVRVDVSCIDHPLWVRGDSIRLNQIVVNLLGNAAKFTPRGGSTEVSVALAPGDCDVLVRIADTGPGIPRELMDHLFQPLTQADRSLARTSGGLGLGLALSKGLVDLHGGSIAATNRSPGPGTVLTVRLPLLRAPEPDRAGVVVGKLLDGPAS